MALIFLIAINSLTRLLMH